ncbi:DMSO reductase iron-sulfur subunit [Edwardsiella tarda]|nr:DMSO reductase iron-sulfur subunit [Edwardsiella tarda]
MTTQYGFYIDSSRCTGCKTCELACKDYKDLPPDINFRRIYEYAGGEWHPDGDTWHHDVFAYYLSISCNHCDDPALRQGMPERRDAQARGWLRGGGRVGMHRLSLLPHGLSLRRAAIQRAEGAYDQMRRLL